MRAFSVSSHVFTRNCGFLFAIAAALLPQAISAAEKRNITEKDLFNFVWVGDPQLSSDGSRVAFVRVSANEKKEGYETSLWSVSTAGGEEPHRLTTGTHDTSPRWSPDGKYLVFIRATEKEGKPEPGQLCMLPMTGGDAFQFTSLPKGAGGIVWSPEGKQIAFTSSSNPEDLAKQEKKKQKEEALKKAAAEGQETAKRTEAIKEDEGERESDAHVITRAVYRSNDEGYLDPKRPQHIWTVTAPRTAEEKVQPTQLTSGRFDEGDPLWSKDGTRIYFTTSRVDEPYYELPKTELYSIAASGGEPMKITTIDMDGSDFALSPDGKQMAFVASVNEPVNSYTQPDLWTIELTPDAKPRNLTGGFDWDLAAGVFGDNAAPRAGGGDAPIWSADGKNILEIYSKQGRTNIGRFDAATGALTEVTQGNQAVARVRARADGSKLVYLVSTPTRIGDLFVLEPGGQPRQLTDVNRELFTQLNLSEPEEVWYDTFDGKRVQAWLQKPPVSMQKRNTRSS